MAEGRLTPDQVLASSDEMNRSGRHQGGTLVDMGLLTYPELEDALRRQFLWKVDEICGWEEGIFRYKDCAIPAAYRGAFLDDPAQLLWASLDRCRPAERARRRLWPVLDSVVTWSGGGMDLSRLELPAAAYHLTEQIDGVRTAAQLVDSSTDPQIAMLGLFALTAFGTLTYSSAPS